MEYKITMEGYVLYTYNCSKKLKEHLNHTSDLDERINQVENLDVEVCETLQGYTSTDHH